MKFYADYMNRKKGSRPAGIFRKPDNMVMFEALTRNRKWVLAPATTDDYLNGAVDLVEMTEKEAKQAAMDILKLTETEVDKLFA